MDQKLQQRLARREHTLSQRRSALVKEVVAAGGNALQDSRIEAIDMALYYTAQAMNDTATLKRNSVCRLAAHRDTLFLK